MVLVAGSANLDFVVRSAHRSRPGRDGAGRRFRDHHPGGKGASQGAGLRPRRRRGRPTCLAALGRDAYAVPIEASLADAGVVLHAVRVPEQATGTAFICVSDDAENAITVAPGAPARSLASAHLASTGLPPLARLEPPAHAAGNPPGYRGRLRPCGPMRRA